MGYTMGYTKVTSSHNYVNIRAAPTKMLVAIGTHRVTIVVSILFTGASKGCMDDVTSRNLAHLVVSIAMGVPKLVGS